MNVILCPTNTCMSMHWRFHLHCAFFDICLRPPRRHWNSSTPGNQFQTFQLGNFTTTDCVHHKIEVLPRNACFNVFPNQSCGDHKNRRVEQPTPDGRIQCALLEMKTRQTVAGSVWKKNIKHDIIKHNITKYRWPLNLLSPAKPAQNVCPN